MIISLTAMNPESHKTMRLLHTCSHFATDFVHHYGEHSECHARTSAHKTKQNNEMNALWTQGVERSKQIAYRQRLKRYIMSCFRLHIFATTPLRKHVLPPTYLMLTSLYSTSFEWATAVCQLHLWACDIQCHCIRDLLRTFYDYKKLLIIYWAI